ncbi:MAG: NADH-quinone oxidoreductase subunit L [Ktedonobacterales bacterium]
MLNLTPYILLLPLIGFVVLGLVGRGMPRGLISLIGCGTILAAFVLAVVDFVSMLGQPAGARSSDVTLWTWMTSGSLSIHVGLLSDQLSAIMLLIVTGVGFLIHVYSIGYMEDDPGYWRFFSFLNLFVFAMTLLVAADNFLVLLVGWAGVGLASFLLIGYWYTRPSAVAAARKAFVVNVIGDFGLMLAIFLLFTSGFTTLAYSDILTKSALSGVSSGTLTAITLLLFVAAAAKSAQLPLHVWLPDAMEGPTPVSALIHAATMVTAGVYLVARAAPLFSLAPNALAVVGIIGGASAFFAATIACVQTDIKRVLAYSTMSQLGYMFMGEAATGFSAGIFHLTTHAYFKALLFMAAGAVIHALAGEQDIRKMGGLQSKLPITYVSFLFGGLALAAIVPFAGFWSKDAILGALLAQAQANPTGSLGILWYVLYALGVFVAALTGFYTFRLFFVVFHGTYRGSEIAAAHGAAGSHTNGNGGRSGRRDPLAHVHDIGLAMGVPMMILAVLSVVGGFYGTPFANWIGDFLAPVTGASPEPSGGFLWLNDGLGLVAAGIGIAIAYSLYGRRQPSFAPSRNPLRIFLEHGWYVDELYDNVIVRPILWLGRALQSGLEGGLDLSSRGVGGAIGLVSNSLRALQTGYVRNYALAIFVGAALIVLYYVVHP